MPIIKGLEWTFNTVYKEYDKWRPTYVDELYDDIFAYKEINSSSKVVEIGIGTGQATLPILETGCFLTAVEFGDELSLYAKQKFNCYRKFDVVNAKFEDFTCEDNSLDLIYSASAFHWIPEEIGYRKAFNLLKSGGVFARFANHPYKDKSIPEMHEALKKVYDVYMPRTLGEKEYSEDNAKNRADIAKKYGFIDIDYKMYYRTRTFTSDEYISLLGTYSDHIAIQEEKRKEFFAEIKKAIDELGGLITIFDTIDLELARKP
ncbi:class I SAM-dependent methyltransferase [Vallitalea guaymasensis]|uniref:Methyltransferase domain-containing protein n=1 Tax=Vallitalea guaymasensis TaxID=1185412 RepID=A0A8J8M9B5_9FIRM|nr:class I SAM-dependent methyltransferase [Vallitalea guaymasensis]QUH28713.1 methyltransferase domain-containing protein [Vallitalea guaymasensis]